MTEDFFNKGVFLQYYASLSGCMSLLIPGINYGWTSPYLPRLISNTSHIPTTNDQGSWCAIMPILGEPIGAAIGGVLIDRIGRKSTIWFMSPIQVLALIILMYSSTIWQITLARCLIGITDGLLFTSLPIYIAEICEPERRGLLSSFITIPGVVGVLIIAAIGPYTTIFTSSMLIMTIPIIHIFAFVNMPESPYYLIKKMKLKAAFESLKSLRDNDTVQREFDDLCKAVGRQESFSEAKFSDLWVYPNNRKACFIAIIMCLVTKCCGEIPILFYCTTIFEESKGGLDENMSTIITSLVEVFTVIAVIGFIDKFGRKILIIISTCGSCVCLVVLGLHNYFLPYSSYPTEQMSWVPLTFIITYFIAFNCGLSFGMYVIMGEIFPTSVKGKAVGVFEAFATFVAVSVLKFFQYSKDTYGLAVPFLTFSVICLLLLFFIVKYIPETTGKSLEEIQLSLSELDICEEQEFTKIRYVEA